MYDENTKLKDLTEMERLVIGGSVNFVYNILNNQIDHIENHDPELAELLITNEKAQEDYILLQNFREVAEQLTEVFAKTFSKMSTEEINTLAKPGMKLDNFFKEIFQSLSCDNN